MIKQDNNNCVKADYVFVFRTVFPYFEFFLKIIFQILNLIKIDRIKIFPLYESKNDFKSFLLHCDSHYIPKYLKHEI